MTYDLKMKSRGGVSRKLNASHRLNKYQGSFNPYGNGQATTIVRAQYTGPWVTGTQYNVTLFTAPSAGTYNFGTINIVLTAGISAGTYSENPLCAIYLGTAPTLTWTGNLTATVIGAVVPALNGINNASTGVAVANALPIPINVGSRTMTSGQVLGLSILSAAGGGRYVYAYTAATSSAAQDVNVTNSSLAVTGTVGISGTVPISAASTLNTNVTNGSLPVTGTVAISGTVPISSASTLNTNVTNASLPVSATISGTVPVSVASTINTNVTNASLPVTATISGTVPVSVASTINTTVTNTPLPISGTVTANITAPITLTGTLDTHIVGIDALDNPLWTTSIVSNAPVMYPPPAVTSVADHEDTSILEGSFNAYGNEQLDNPIEQSRLLNPFPTQTDENYEYKSVCAVLIELVDDSKLDPVVKTFASNLIDEDVPLKTMPGYRVFQTDETFDERVKQDVAIRDKVKGLTEGGAQQRKPKPQEVVEDKKKANAHTKAIIVTRALARLKKQTWRHAFVWLSYGDKLDVDLAQKITEGLESASLPDVNSVEHHLCRHLASGVSNGAILDYVGTRVPPLGEYQMSRHYKRWIVDRFGGYFSGVSPRVLPPSKSVFSSTDNVDSLHSCCDTKEIEDYHVALEHKSCAIAATESETVEYASDAVRQIMIDNGFDPESDHFNAVCAQVMRGGNLKCSSKPWLKPQIVPQLNGSHGEFTESDDVEVVGIVDMSDKPKCGSFNAYGNEQMSTFWPKQMSDITSGNSGIKELFESQGDVPAKICDPNEDYIRQAGVRQRQGSQFQQTSRAMAFRGAGQTTAATVLSSLTDYAPETLLFPAKVWDPVGGDWIDNTIYPPVRGAADVMRSESTEMSPSPDFTVLSEIIGKAGNIRPSQVTRLGFYTNDAVMTALTGPENQGGCLEMMYLKYQLYMNTLTWRSPVASLPLGGQVSMLNRFGTLPVNPTVTLGYNSVANYGANTPVGGHFVYPFGQQGGQVYFHVTTATIPDGAVWFALRSGLLITTDSGSSAMNIAQHIMGVAPYPLGIYSVSITDPTAPAVAPCCDTFIPMSGQVSLTGQAGDIHILLTVRNPANPPTDGPTANSLVFIRPTTGPTATPGGIVPALAANTPLNICFQGAGGLIGYNICDFMYTWLAGNSPIDSTSISRYMSNVASMLGRHKDLDSSWEKASLLSNVYTRMATDTDAARANNYYNTIGTTTVATPLPWTTTGVSAAQTEFWKVTDYMGFELEQMAGNYGTFVFDYPDFFTGSLGYMWWNKICMGMYNSVADMTQRPPLRSWDNNPLRIAYTSFVTRDYAVVAEYLLTYLGTSTATLNSAFTNTFYPNLGIKIQALFARAQFNNSIPISEAGYALAVAHGRIHDYAPARNGYGLTIYETRNTPRIGWLAPLGSTFAGAPWATTVFSLMIPTILPDYIPQLETKYKTASFSPFMGPTRGLIGYAAADQAVVDLGGGCFSTPMKASEQAFTVSTHQIPEVDDISLFNQRLAVTAFRYSAFTFGATAVANLPFIPFLSRLYGPPDWTVDGVMIQPGPLTSSTRMYPYMDNSSRKLTLGTTDPAFSQLYSRVYAGVSTTAVCVWLFDDVTPMPATVITAGGANVTNKMIRRTTASGGSVSPSNAEGGDKK